VKDSFPIACLFGCALLLGDWSSQVQAEDPANSTPKLKTVAERSDYQATSRSTEVLSFLEQLAATTPHVSTVTLGYTVEQRPLTAAVVAQPPVNAPADLQSDSRLVVLLLGNIHPGECAGKEALLELLRAVASDPNHPWLKDLVLLFLPNYNADGNDRMSTGHRPGQVGPSQGMGWRQNAQGLDLNRDFIKLETPECRALVQTFNDWDPHLFIDTHTTNGSRHRYLLTYDAPHNPAAPARIRTFLRDQMLPEITRRLEEQEIATSFYGRFNAEHTAWTTYGDAPRYSTEYVGLRGRLAILSEAYAYATYQQRITASREFVRECVDYASQHAQEIRDLTAAVRQATVEAGRAPTVGDNIPLASEVKPYPEKVTLRGYELASTEQNAADKGTVQLDKPKDYEVDYVADYQPTRSVQRPFAYLLPGDASRIADRLRMHGIHIQQLTQSTTLNVQSYEITSVERARRSYQRHRQSSVNVKQVESTHEFPAGTYVMFSAQPLGNLLVYLLEPTSTDGLVAWNFFDAQLQKDSKFLVHRVASPADMVVDQVETIVPREKLSLNQIYGPTGRVPLAPSPVRSTWISGTSHYTRRIGDRTVRVDAATGGIQPAEDNSGLAEALATLSGVSADDAGKMAARANQWDARRESVLINWANDLFYWKRGATRAVRLTHDNIPEQYATFSPDAKLVAFVREHNLFVADVATGQERALTTAGNADLLHGQLDWVYQEELYGRGRYRAFWWSPDSRWLAFLKLDQSSVPEFTITDNIPHHPRLEVGRYPLAGDPNSIVSLGIVAAAGGPARWFEHPDYGREELLISRVDWSVDGKHLVYQLQDRAQTWLDLRQVNPETGSAKTLLREKTEAWVSVLGPPHGLKDGSFLWLSERTGNKHIYHVSADGQKCQPVTSGPWDVDTLYGVDPEEAWVYFLATKDRAISTRAYRVHLDGTQLECLTPQPGCHRISLDETKSHFLDTCSTVDRPADVKLYRSNGELVRTVDPNLEDRLKYYELGATEFRQVAARDGLLLDALLIKPTDFDPAKKYPVLCYVYAGPQSPVVWNRWLGQTYLWHQFLAQQGYVVWLFNNRSASTLGARHAWSSYKQLGKQELSDIEDGITWLKQQPWVDGQRIGIWGWSYGGFMTSYALTHSESFKMGVAVAPVTDWHNYDSIYTERFMDLPQNNPEGYAIGSVVDAAAKLRGRLLLVHGTIDDNVHVSNALQLANALQNAGQQFDLMLYPGNRHGISRSRQSRHLRELLTQFVLKHL
jgi:dipeptidyl-peptidase-4